MSGSDGGRKHPSPKHRSKENIAGADIAREKGKQKQKKSSNSKEVQEEKK